MQTCQLRITASNTARHEQGNNVLECVRASTLDQADKLARVEDNLPHPYTHVSAPWRSSHLKPCTCEKFANAGAACAQLLMLE